jgi:hypothetical protein
MMKMLSELLVYEVVQQEVMEQPRMRTAVVPEIPDALFCLNNPVPRSNYGGLENKCGCPLTARQIR